MWAPNMDIHDENMERRRMLREQGHPHGYNRHSDVCNECGARTDGTNVDNVDAIFKERYGDNYKELSAPELAKKHVEWSKTIIK